MNGLRAIAEEAKRLARLLPLPVIEAVASRLAASDGQDVETRGPQQGIQHAALFKQVAEHETDGRGRQNVRKEHDRPVLPPAMDLPIEDQRNHQGQRRHDRH